MSSELIAPVAAAGVAGLQPFEAVAPPSGNFGEWLGKEVTQLNQVMLAAESRLQDQAAGRTQNLHEVMIAMEEARLSLQLAMQIRNKVLDAYQELMRMQI